MGSVKKVEVFAFKIYMILCVAKLHFLSHFVIILCMCSLWKVQGYWGAKLVSNANGLLAGHPLG